MQEVVNLILSEGEEKNLNREHIAQEIKRQGGSRSGTHHAKKFSIGSRSERQEKSRFLVHG
jgi:hypothetical protein